MSVEAAKSIIIRAFMLLVKQKAARMPHFRSPTISGAMGPAVREQMRNDPHQIHQKKQNLKFSQSKPPSTEHQNKKTLDS